MTMEVKSRLLFFPVVIVIASTTQKPITTTQRTTIMSSTPWTTDSPGVNLNKKMFTLSNDGGIYFYPPHYSPKPSSWPSSSYTHHFTPSSSYPSWTTPLPSTAGLSVCLRHITLHNEKWKQSYTVFSISPYGPKSLTLRFDSGSYVLSYSRYGYSNLYLTPNIRLLTQVAPEIWTRLCLTIDSMKGVAQVFEDSKGSIRALLREQFAWSDEPVMVISGFEGQVTDIQMWDYPLQYSEVLDYMKGGAYRLSSGSILSWSYISFSLRGKVLLEDVYEILAKRATSRRGRRRQRKGGKTRRVFNVGGK